MPTGYTDIIGRGATFEEFVLRCARAFGALVEMRDDSTDAAIPDKFEPGTYHAENLRKAEQQLIKLENTTINAAKISANADYCLAVVERNESIEKNRKTIEAYQAMLEKVVEWIPPTFEHQELKKFMIVQIESSRKFDDMENYYLEHPVKKLTGIEYLAQQISSVERNITYYTENNQKEIERAAGRTQWIQDLRKSLETKKA